MITIEKIEQLEELSTLKKEYVKHMAIFSALSPIKPFVGVYGRGDLYFQPRANSKLFSLIDSINVR